MSDAVIRVLVVDDHTVVRKGICALLNSARSDLQVIGEAGDGDEAIRKVNELHPDVILMDLVMPKLSGVETIIAITQANPNAKILVLTSYDEDARVSTAIQAGALGYLLKTTPADDLFQAIRTVYSGQMVVPGKLARRIMMGGQQSPAAGGFHLTRRELEIISGIAQGLSNQKIADQLTISLYTVRSHVRNILRKLNLTNRTQIAIYGVEANLGHKSSSPLPK